MLSLMEGFRRAYRLPPENWTFWGRRARALMLVFIVSIPLSLASLVIVFGHQIEHWMIENAGHDLRHVVVFFWRMVRWVVSFAAILTVLTALYHFGTRRTEHWSLVAPGAIAGTLIWFPATLAYGWYVTSVANYTRLYGSFAAGIATLVWLYITSFSVLLGAELNGVLYWERQNQIAAESSAHEPARALRRYSRTLSCLCSQFTARRLSRFSVRVNPQRDFRCCVWPRPVTIKSVAPLCSLFTR